MYAYSYKPPCVTLDFESVYSCSAPLTLQRLLASMAGPSGLSIWLVQVWRVHLIQPRQCLHSAINLESLYLHGMVKIDAVLFDDCAVVSMESCVPALSSTVHGISVYKSGCTCIQSKISVIHTNAHAVRKGNPIVSRVCRNDAAAV